MPLLLSMGAAVYAVVVVALVFVVVDAVVVVACVVVGFVLLQSGVCVDCFAAVVVRVVVALDLVVVSGSGVEWVVLGWLHASAVVNFPLFVL